MKPDDTTFLEKDLKTQHEPQKLRSRPKKSRVRTPPSESVVGVKNADLFADMGSRGDSLWRGVGPRPTKPNQ